MSLTRTVSDLKSDLTRKVHGMNLSKVSDINNLIREGASNVISRIDPVETKRYVQITNAIHDRIYDYPLPSDFKKPIDLQRQANRSVADIFARRLTEEFDAYKSLGTLSIKDSEGVKSIRISKSLSGRITVDNISGISTNGTWAVGDDATTLTADTLDYITSGASLKFNLDGSGTSGYIENSTITDVDLTDQEDLGSMFCWVFIPSTAVMTSIDLRWGSDSSNYWNKTVTAASDATAFRKGWNLLRFDWDTATETGSPVVTEVDYLRVTINYSGVATNGFRVDNIISSLGTIFEVAYYSKFLFKSTAGTYLEKPTATDDTDVINLDTDGYNILLYECALLIAQEVSGENSAFDLEFFDKKLNENVIGLYSLYSANHVQESMQATSTWYGVTRQNRTR